jgi:two-component system sensor histidine kinase ChiS
MTIFGKKNINDLRNKSLHKEFILFKLYIIILFSVTSLIIGFSVYNSEKNQSKVIYKLEAAKIDNVLSETFDYITHYMNFIGQKIVDRKRNDPDFIANIFYNKINDNLLEHTSYSWTLFDWVNPQKKMTVNSVHGKFEKPIDMSIRKHLKFTEKKPWKLFFSEPVKGIPSGQMVIPAGIGVADTNGRFYGTIVTGFNIDKLLEKIERAMTRKELVFLLLDEDYNIVTYSTYIKFVLDNTLTENFTKNIKSQVTSDKENILTDRVELVPGLEFSYYKKLDKYPYTILLGINDSYINKELYQIIIPRIIELSFLGLVCIGIFYYVTYNILKPISALSSSAEDIATNKHTDVPISNYKELATLSDSLIEIQHIRNNLAEARILLEEKVQERTAELEKALTAKTEFLNNMSHEVRTPIQGVTAISRGLVEHWQDFNDQQKYEYASQVASNADRLFSLVNNLLDLSKFNAGKMVIDKQLNDLTVITEEIIQECKPLFNQKKLEVELVKVGENLPLICFDKDRIGQVIRNLIANAIKFTPKGKVIVSIFQRDFTHPDGKTIKGLCLSVKDEGIGIPERELNDIFDVFTQSSRTKTKAGGTGLGLSISSEIINLHNGQIWADNNSDKGSTFFFVLPLEEQICVETNTTPITKLNANILVIDDEDACLNSMGLLLHDTGCKLVKINSGHLGLDYLRKNKGEIDIVLLDLMMPDMYGLNVLTEIRKDAELKDIPVILQSGTHDETEVAKAFDLGIVGYINKPYKKEKIISTIKDALGKL